MRKRVIAAALAGLMSIGLAACGSNSSSGASATLAAETADETASTAVESDGSKQDLIMLISVPDESFNDDIMNLVQTKLQDKYNVVIKTWSGGPDTIQAIKTASIAGQQIDLAMYWPNSMAHFIDSNQATPLDDYLTDEWKSRFAEGALDLGSRDGHIYNTAYSTVYPVVILNKTMAKDAGVALPENGQWSWAEFEDYAQTMYSDAGVNGVVCPSGFNAWLGRNGIMEAWPDDAALDKWNSGEVSFTSDEIVKVMDTIKNDIDNNVFYPGGEAALAIENDEAYAAVASGKVAGIMTVNSMAQEVISKCGLDDNYLIMDWPQMGENPSRPVLGGSNGYFIPTTVKNMDGAIEALDILTSEEAATIRAEAGCVSTIAPAADADVDTELISLISRDSAAIHHEITELSADLGSEGEKLTANYYHYGMQELEEIDALRQEAITE